MSESWGRWFLRNAVVVPAAVVLALEVNAKGIGKVVPFMASGSRVFGVRVTWAHAAAVFFVAVVGGALVGMWRVMRSRQSPRDWSFDDRTVVWIALAALAADFVIFFVGVRAQAWAPGAEIVPSLFLSVLYPCSALWLTRRSEESQFEERGSK